MVSQDLANKLSNHLTQMHEAKLHLQRLVVECKHWRAIAKQEEDVITKIMLGSKIGEYSTEQVSLRILDCKRQPTASLKLILPLIQKVFGASDQQMKRLLLEIQTYKTTNTKHTRRLVCKQLNSTKSQNTAPRPNMEQRTSTPSLSRAINSLIG